MFGRRWLSGVMFLSLLLFFSPLFLIAHQLFAAELPSEKPSDVRIVIDISGSMKETDPQNLRVPALNLLTELLPDNARAGVWTFGRMVNMLVPLSDVDQQWRDKAKGSAAKISSVGLKTNLVEALDKSLWQLSADSGFDQSIILLTDGKIDMGEGSAQNAAAANVNQKEKDRLISSILPRYIEAGAKIHTLALSEAADSAMLQQISLETGGLFLQASSADELLKAFLKAFDRAVPVEQVPMENNKFDIDDSVQEFTALIFRQASSKNTRLISPSGKIYSDVSSRSDEQVRWHHDLNFDLVTIKEPETGSWQADADVDPDNRVQILTDLKLRVDGLPSAIFAGYPVDLTMALTEKDAVVTDRTILSLTDISLKVTAPDGRAGSKLLSDPETLPDDGVFAESLTRLSQQGEYQIEVTAVGRTFQRRQILTTTLMEPLQVSVDPDFDQQVLNIRVSPEVDNVDTSLSRVIARVSSPDESSVIQSMEFNEDEGAWLLPLTADKGEGEYQVLLNIRGVTSTGTTFKSKPENIVADFPLKTPEQIAAGSASADMNTDQIPAIAPAEELAGDAQGGSEASGDPQSPPPPSDEVGEASMQEEEPVNDVADETDADTEEAPQEETEPATEDIVPDLAEKFEQQPVAESSEEVVNEAATEEGVAWWIYLILALGNLAVFGGVAFWWFVKRKPTDLTAQAAAPAADSKLPPDLDTPEFDEADLDGDFDAFDDESEEEISMPGPAADTGMGADAGLGDDLGLDDDFSIDPEDGGAAEEDWGEFDDDASKPDDT